MKEFGSIENLLQENTSKLTGALKTKVEENREKIEFSRFLATIKIDVPVEWTNPNLSWKNPDKANLIELFSESGVRSYLAKLQGGLNLLQGVERQKLLRCKVPFLMSQKQKPVSVVAYNEF